MANLPEGADDFPAGIYQIEAADPVLGGAPNETTKAGLTNIPHQQLARRTGWLKMRVDQLVNAVVAASTTMAGLVQLSSATNSTSETLAATPAAVKTVADSRVPTTRSVNTAGLATGGGTLEANRTITVQDASQAEAEAGTATNRAMSPLRVTQAIANRMRMRNLVAAGLATGGGTLDADRTITVTPATQEEAEAGTSNTRAMTPLAASRHAAQQRRVRQDVSGERHHSSLIRVYRSSGGDGAPFFMDLGTLSGHPFAINSGTADAFTTTHWVHREDILNPGVPYGASSMLTRRMGDGRYVREALLAGVNAGNGYRVLPGGVIIQWGSATLPVGAGVKQVTVAMPITFPTAAFRVIAGDNADGSPHAVGASFSGRGTVIVRSEDDINVVGDVQWFAIGC